MRLSSPSSIRTINRLRVLNLVRAREGISRADISKELSLNKPSCSEIVQELIGEGLVEEGEKSETATGRRPTPLSLAKSGKVVAGISIGLKLCIISLADIAGNVLGFKQIPTPPKPSPKDLCLLVLKELIHMYHGPIMGCAISVHGDIDEKGESIKHLPWWGWEDVPLSQVFEHNLHCPCLIVDETEAMVDTEWWLSKNLPEDFLYLNWGEHVGSCMVHGSRMERGYLGHVKVTEAGECACGGTGCLETVSAAWAIERAWQGTPLRTLMQERSQGFEQSLDNAALALGMVAAQACTITGLRHVILSGSVILLQPSLLERVSQAMRHSLPPFMKDTDIVLSPLGDKARMLGPISAALEKFVFQSATLEQFGA